MAELQTLLDRFAKHYNHRRPHRGIGRRTPVTAYQARPEATPADQPATTDPRIRRDRVDTASSVTVRYRGRLHHIGIGRAHVGSDILLMIIDRKIRLIDADTGELLRELVLDPTRDYHPRRLPRHSKRAEPVGSALCRCPETSQGSAARLQPATGRVSSADDGNPDLKLQQHSYGDPRK